MSIMDKQNNLFFFFFLFITFWAYIRPYKVGEKTQLAKSQSSSSQSFLGYFQLSRGYQFFPKSLCVHEVHLPKIVLLSAISRVLVEHFVLISIRCNWYLRSLVHINHPNSAILQDCVQLLYDQSTSTVARLCFNHHN